MLRRVISLFLIFGLFFQQVSFAQVAAELNIGGYLARMHSAMTIDKFRPMHLRYFNYDINSHNFKVLIDKGDLKNPATGELENSTKELLNYFLVGLTLHNESFWVNLRPDSQDQIIDNYLVQTDVGRIMLEADLQLKKDTAKLTSPETPEGKEYWNRLYKKTEELFGYENVSIPTLTRPWIVPGEIIIHETETSAYVYKATLKVMLEQDYLKDSSVYNFKDARSQALNDYSSELIRELIIPKLTKEVNSSQRYANIRQVYYSLILSRWFKNKFAGQSGGYASRINTLDLTGLTSQEPWSKTTYFKEYQKSFKEGEYNIKESVYTPTGQVIRSYFSGGIQIAGSPIDNLSGINSGTIHEKSLRGYFVRINADGTIAGSSPIRGDKAEELALRKQHWAVQRALGAYKSGVISPEQAISELIATGISGEEADSIVRGQDAAGSPIENINERINELESNIAERQNRIKEIQAEISANERKINDFRIELFSPDTFKSARAAKDTKKLQEQNNTNRAEIFRIRNHIREMSIELNELREKAAKAESAAYATERGGSAMKSGGSSTVQASKPIAEIAGKQENLPIKIPESVSKGEAILVVYKDDKEYARIDLNKLQSYRRYGDINGERSVKTYAALDGSFYILFEQETMYFTNYSDYTFVVSTEDIKSASSAISVQKLTGGKLSLEKLEGEEVIFYWVSNIPPSLPYLQIHTLEQLNAARQHASEEEKEIFKRLTSGPDAFFNLDRDKEGRVIIPAALIEKANLGEEIVVVKGTTYYEIWSKENWDKNTGAASSALNSKVSVLLDYLGKVYGKTENKIFQGKTVLFLAPESDAEARAYAQKYPDTKIILVNPSFVATIKQEGNLLYIGDRIENIRGYTDKIKAFTGKEKVDAVISAGVTDYEPSSYPALAEAIKGIIADNVEVLLVEGKGVNRELEETFIGNNFNVVNLKNALSEPEAGPALYRIALSASSAVSVAEKLQQIFSVTTHPAGFLANGMKKIISAAQSNNLKEAYRALGDLENQLKDYTASWVIWDKNKWVDKRSLEWSYDKKKWGADAPYTQEQVGQTIYFLYTTLPKAKQALESETAGSPTETETPASSAVQAVKEPGGIDFRALPMTIKPMGSFEGLNLRLPQLSSSALLSFNLGQEIEELNKMISGGIIPSGARVQELVAAAWQKGAMEECQTEILTILAEICKLQEGECCEASNELKVALVAANAV